MRDIHVRTWAELDSAVFGDSWDHELRRHRSRCAFRGMKDASFSLSGKLARFGPRAAELENPLLRTFRRYARRLADADDSAWSWLAVAQHHGLPTRLLDWSFSPYVALHFMTEDTTAFDRPGVVWAVDYMSAKEHLPPSLQEILREESANVFTAEMLSRAVSSLGALDKLGQEHGEPFVVFLEPPSLDDRIVSQYALFSMSPRMGKEDKGLETSLGRAPKIARRIIIPPELKWEVRDRLDQTNLTERVLYPGLDGLAKWLARYYTPRA
jgi:hypothetical protein